MRSPLIALLTIGLIVAGCDRIAESRFNPFNWFGEGRQEATTLLPRETGNAVRDGRRPVDQIVMMRVEPAPGGAIVRATGLPETQGWWDAALRPESDAAPDDGVLRFVFVAAPPPAPTRVSTPRSRELTAATFVSRQRLEGVRQITVRAARNQSTSRR